MIPSQVLITIQQFHTLQNNFHLINQKRMILSFLCRHGSIQQIITFSKMKLQNFKLPELALKSTKPYNFFKTYQNHTKQSLACTSRRLGTTPETSLKKKSKIESFIQPAQNPQKQFWLWLSLRGLNCVWSSNQRFFFWGGVGGGDIYWIW